MLELEHGFRVVDVHARLEPDASRRPMDGMGDPEELEREMHQAGVVRSVVSPGDRSGSYLKANNAVARMSVGRPFLAFARLSGTRDTGSGPGPALRNLTSSRGPEHTSPADVEQYAYDDRFVGFTIDPVTDGMPDEEVMAALADADRPLQVHGGRGFPPNAIEEHVLAHDVPVILAHFGGYPLDRELMHDAVDSLDAHDRLYLDTSYVRFRDVLERAIREHPDRVLFGSGAPGAHPNVAIMEILTLDVPENAMTRVFSNNPVRVVEALAP
jgi:hypothetical protein